jgi:hypothetical protein
MKFKLYQRSLSASSEMLGIECKNLYKRILICSVQPCSLFRHILLIFLKIYLLLHINIKIQYYNITVLQHDCVTKLGSMLNEKLLIVTPNCGNKGFDVFTFVKS